MRTSAPGAFLGPGALTSSRLFPGAIRACRADRISELKTLALTSHPWASHLPSIDSVTPRSARKPRRGISAPSPTASTSSTKGVGAANPAPAEALRLQGLAGLRKSAESLGLKNVPYTLLMSIRAAPWSFTQDDASNSSCANSAGTLYVYPTPGTEGTDSASCTSAIPAAQA